MSSLDDLQAGLAVAAFAVSIAALAPVVWQAYFDYVSRWPYLVKLDGLLPDPVAPVVKKFGFKVLNRTSQTAFFEIRTTGDCIDGFEVPYHIGVWPSQDQVRLYLEVPPRVWREVRVTPFSPQDSRTFATWGLIFVEFYHRGKPAIFDWPTDLNKPPPTSALYTRSP